MSQERHLAHWQQEILIETLLVQDAPHLALRALRAPGPPIAPLLEIRTLLASNLVAEAFQLQRSKADGSLLNEFFKTCHTQHKWHYVLDLSLNNAEEEALGCFLRTSDSTLTSNLHFIYLLQRSKYIEAISYIDDLHHNRRRRKPDLDTPNTIVAAYKLTMTPATRSMSDVYYSLRDNIDTKLNQKAINPNPLSTKLLQRKLDLVGGIYHRTVLSAEQTTPAYWLGQPNKRCNLTPNNVPFLRNPQYDVQELAHKQHMHHNTGLSYAMVYVESNKRNLSESVLDIDERRNKEKDEGPRKRRKIDPNAANYPIAISKVKPTVETTLSTPIVNTTERTPPKSTLHYTAVTPQSILKIPGSPARLIRMRSLSPISADIDDRSIRFNLPDNQDDYRSVTPVATSTIRLSPRAALDFTVDNDVTTEKISSTMSDNESAAEDFFSPEISHVMERQEEEDKEEPAEVVTPPENIGQIKLLDYSQQESPLQRRIAVLEGPKARKRIHDGCGGGGDISQPVEDIGNVKKANNSTLVPQISTPPKGNTSSHQTVQRKPLSRIVLEANAKKIIDSADQISVLTAPKATSSANVSDITFNSTTVDSRNTTPFGRFVSDDSDLSESFMDRWKAERRLANASYTSSMNDGTSLFERESFVLDSDASFVADQQVEDIKKPLYAQHTTEPANPEDVFIVEEDTCTSQKDEEMVIAEDNSDEDDEDNGSISLNSDLETEESSENGESGSRATTGEEVSFYFVFKKI